MPHLPPVGYGKGTFSGGGQDLPNRPFRIDSAPINLPLSVATRDLVHKFYQNQEQIGDGVAPIAGCRRVRTPVAPRHMG